VNVFDEIQGSRPEVAPMALAKRRMIRESLFGIGHDDSTRTISGRSESGAVVSTAPHGMRRPIQKQARPAGSLAKLGAGLLVFAVLGAVVWSYSTRDDAVDIAESTTTTATTTTTSTVAPTTVPPVVRTGVNAGVPLALPPLLVPVDEVVVAPAAPGSSSLILGAPDGSEVWMAEFDGEPADPSGLDVRQVGAIGVGVDSNREEGALASYRLLVPCGIVIVNDGPGQPLDRQPIVDLFSAFSIDGDATIDISLPTDWSVFSIGDSRTSYTVQFQVPAPEGAGDAGIEPTAPIRISQMPGGSFAQLMFGGRQLDPIEFLGAPAFIDVGAADPSLVSVFWQDDSTVFNASSSVLALADIEAFVDVLEPVAIENWNQRFAIAEPEAAAEPPACAPQPNFGPTLNP
jgi:hypothetical protein